MGILKSYVFIFVNITLEENAGIALLDFSKAWSHPVAWEFL